MHGVQGFVYRTPLGNQSGILFLDEFPEFSGTVLESLRTPLEEGRVHISRAGVGYDFPADFSFIAAMNPCPCGYYPDYSKCKCTDYMISRYLGKISGPLLERIDMCVVVPKVEFCEMKKEERGESSAAIRMRVEEVHEIQKRRFKDADILFNSQMNVSQIEEFCRLDSELENRLERLFEEKKFSVRTFHRILKVARTIADMKRHDKIQMSDLNEAIMYKEDVFSWR